MNRPIEKDPIPFCMHVLIISNDESDLKWVNDPLTATGFTVTVINAFSIREARTLLNSVWFDLVLYDLSFSENGLPGDLKLLICAGGKTPIIVLTDTLGDPSVKEAMKNGAHDYMVKDRFRLGTMAESFKTILLKHTATHNIQLKTELESTT